MQISSTKFSIRDFFQTKRQSTGRMLVLVIAAIFQGLACWGILKYSGRFSGVGSEQQRPILEVLGLMTLCFVIHLVALTKALCVLNQRLVAAIVVIPAIIFRIILLPSEPIQEVDIYRYLWDGAVLSQGVSPFRYSPNQVQQALTSAALPLDLAKLVETRDNSPELASILARVHFCEVTTVYPPVSQVVFALGHRLAPRNASVGCRIFVMKSIMTLFDVGTIFLIFALLNQTEKPLGWAICYAWSPLVLKEFANSGHLDAVAVFLTTGSVLCWISGWKSDSPGRVIWFLSAGLLLGLATAAKLYPIVLLPVFALMIWKKSSWHVALLSASLTLGIPAMSVWEMLSTAPTPTTWQTGNQLEELYPNFKSTVSKTIAPLSNTGVVGRSDLRPQSGLAVFLGSWEMNDAIFLVILENLRTAFGSVPANGPRPWFVVVPSQWDGLRSFSLDFQASIISDDGVFRLARGITLAIFGIIAVGLAWNIRDSCDPVVGLNACFLTIGWFWALSPTLNPWYWIWVMPLLPFVKQRAWFAVSGLVVAYYLRFWISYHFPDVTMFGTGYRGEEFFHFVIAPVEHGLWMTWLLVEWISGASGRRNRSQAY